MYTTALKEIYAFLFGRKYYANIIRTRGVLKDEISSYIFPSLDDALRHRRTIEEGTLTFTFITTVSFRTRHELTVSSYTEPEPEES